MLTPTHNFLSCMETLASPTHSCISNPGHKFLVVLLIATLVGRCRWCLQWSFEKPDYLFSAFVPPNVETMHYELEHEVEVGSVFAILPVAWSEFLTSCEVKFNHAPQRFETVLRPMGRRGSSAERIFIRAS